MEWGHGGVVMNRMGTWRGCDEYGMGTWRFVKNGMGTWRSLR